MNVNETNYARQLEGLGYCSDGNPKTSVGSVIKGLIEKSIKDQEEMLTLSLGETEAHSVRYSILVLKDILKQYEYLRNDEEAINDFKRRNATSE